MAALVSEPWPPWSVHHDRFGGCTMGVAVVSARRSWCSHQGFHGALPKAATLLSEAVSLRQIATKAATCSVHGGHSCQARLVQGLGDRHCGSLGAVTVTVLVLSEAGTVPTVNPRPVGSASGCPASPVDRHLHYLRHAAVLIMMQLP